MLDSFEIILRVVAATATGSAIGMYLEAYAKPTGVRMLGLVALASAIAVLAVAQNPAADASRVIQGVVAGVGFLGTGVILHRETRDHIVRGLSSAATIWMTASLGVLCGLGAWRLWGISLIPAGFLIIMSDDTAKKCSTKIADVVSSLIGRGPRR